MSTTEQPTCYRPPHADNPVDIERYICLNANESPFSISDSLHYGESDPRKYAGRRYPDPQYSSLRRAVAQTFDLHVDQVLCSGDGSSGVLDLLIRHCEGTKGIVISEPTFGLYRALVSQARVRLQCVPLDAEFHVDLSALAETSDDADLQILCNPNNPTGHHESQATIGKAVRQFPGLTVIDEAYGEFSGDTETHSMIPFVRQGEDIVVVRSFSKAFGAAGLRLGYAVGTRERIGKLLALQLPYCVSQFQQDVGERLLQSYGTTMRQEVRQVMAARAMLTERLADVGCSVLPSDASFLLFAPPISHPANEVCRRLRAEHHILVRSFEHPRIANMLRVTVGTPQENEALLRALHNILSP